MTSTAPRCEGSGTRQSVYGDTWATGDTKECTVCHQQAKFRVRVTDRPPWARILPHRTDGTPTR